MAISTPANCTEAYWSRTLQIWWGDSFFSPISTSAFVAIVSSYSGLTIRSIWFEKPSCLWRTRVSAAASFVSSTTVAIISCWQKRNFQDHRGKRRWQGKQGGVVMYPSRYHLHLLLHVRVLLCCNWPYSRFNPACHHPLLEHISSPRLSLSLRRMLHEEHFWTELCHSTQFQIVMLGWFNGEVKTIPRGHQYVTAVCF